MRSLAVVQWTPMVALAPNTSETITWDVLDGFPILHSRARETITARCTEAPLSKSFGRVEIWQAIYETCDGLESFTRDPIGFAGGRNLYSANWSLASIDPFGTDASSADLVETNAIEFPFPQIAANVCGATDCMETGIETRYNFQLVNGPRGPTVAGPCKGYCNFLMVQGHEGEHRKNMGACCNRRNACLSFANTLPPDQVDRFRTLCQGLWGLWKRANWEDLEKRAAVETCRLAKQFKKNCSPCTMPGTWQDCCVDATRTESQACAAMDASAPIETCPFQADGVPDQDAINRNKKKAGIL